MKRYQKSQAMLERALRVIPLGSQTFSKSKTQYPLGVSPHFIAKAKGSKVWDVDGNEYIDFINSLASVTLGYNDPDVTAAVQEQLQYGTIFSLPHELEVQVAEKICQMVPGAEMVRFGKNGSDATSGAIRLARAFTKRDRVAVCGYHGWQDWYIGSTLRNQGVPKAVSDLTHPFQFNDLESLKTVLAKHKGEFAAVILEPMNTTDPKPDFLEGVKALAHEQGALFILDETITGFRFANGGAQEYFGITADLATFGKGLSNGYPVSAISGRRDVMQLMEEIFFSFTFGGETLSLAAALATLNKLQSKPVLSQIWSTGQTVLDKVSALVQKNGLQEVLSVSGKPCWSFLAFKDTKNYNQWQLKTLFLQEVFARGILAIGSHNISYAHSEADIRQLETAYAEVFLILKDAIENQCLEKYLKTEPLVPLFRVR